MIYLFDTMGRSISTIVRTAENGIEERSEKMQTIADMLRQEGMEKGILKGREEGQKREWKRNGKRNGNRKRRIALETNIQKFLRLRRSISKS